MKNKFKFYLVNCQIATTAKQRDTLRVWTPRNETSDWSTKNKLCNRKKTQLAKKSRERKFICESAKDFLWAAIEDFFLCIEIALSTAAIWKWALSYRK